MQNCNFAQFYYKIICANKFFCKNFWEYLKDGGSKELIGLKNYFYISEEEFFTQHYIPSPIESRENRMRNQNFFMLTTIEPRNSRIVLCSQQKSSGVFFDNFYIKCKLHRSFLRMYAETVKKAKWFLSLLPDNNRFIVFQRNNSIFSRCLQFFKILFSTLCIMANQNTVK